MDEGAGRGRGEQTSVLGARRTRGHERVTCSLNTVLIYKFKMLGHGGLL